jgi:hypothetical protein
MAPHTVRVARRLIARALASSSIAAELDMGWLGPTGRAPSLVGEPPEHRAHPIERALSTDACSLPLM